jgi:hypothetical protein
VFLLLRKKVLKSPISKEELRAGGVALVELLPSKCEILSSKPQYYKKRAGRLKRVCIKMRVKK